MSSDRRADHRSDAPALADLRNDAHVHGTLRFPARAVQPGLPFPVDQPYVTEINGEKLSNYIEWMKSCYGSR
jgi:hypothetical protein